MGEEDPVEKLRLLYFPSDSKSKRKSSSEEPVIELGSESKKRGIS